MASAIVCSCLNFTISLCRLQKESQSVSKELFVSVKELYMSRKRALHFLCSCVQLSTIHDLTVYTKKKISRESKKLFISVNWLGSLCPAKESETSAVVCAVI